MNSDNNNAAADSAIGEVVPPAPPTAPAAQKPHVEAPKGNDPVKPDKVFTQEEVDALIGERLERDRKARAKDAEVKSLQERQEWEKLANQYKAEYEPKAQQYDALVQVLDKQLAARTKALPKHIAALAPKTGDIAERLEWIAQAEQAAAEMQIATAPGNGPKPAPSGQSEPTDEWLKDVARRFRVPGTN